MKHVNFYQSPNWKKWGLAGCLLVALGANLSFNPESKTIARNDGVSSGAYSLASSTPIPQPEPPVAKAEESKDKKANGTDEIELKDQYKGLKVKVQYADNKEKARFIIEKHGETQAGICVTCVEKMGPETVAINELDRNNIELTRRAILAAAITQLDKMKPTETKEEKKKEERPKKLDTSVAATFDFEQYRCEKPDDSEDSEVSVSDFRQCLSDNLKDLRQACKEAVQDKYEKDKTAASGKQVSVKKDTASCERLTQQFYREEIRPGTRMIKRGQLNSALQTYQLHFNNARIEALRMGLQDSKATEIAQTRAKLAVSQIFPNMVTMEQTNMKGSLHSLHNLMSSYSNNDPQYVLNFQNEYISPMSNIVSALQSTQNNGINIEQLFRNAMNMDTMLPTGIGTYSGNGIYPSGSGYTQIPGRAPIGGGIPRTGIQGVQGTPQQQQYIQQRQQYPQQQYPQQQYPQQQIRQGGSLPGLRVGM